MNKKVSFDEFDLLDYFYQTMINKGISRNQAYFMINDRTIEELYEITGYSLTKTKMESLADICLANEWLKPAAIGGNPPLRLTSNGKGIVISKRKQAEKSSMKKYQNT